MKFFLPFTFLLVFTTFISDVKAQSCFNINAGNDTTISCLQACLDLKAKVPDVKSTDDYKVVPITYNPYPFINSATGIEYNPFYLDDLYSPEIVLPFTFCFFGQNYTRCAVGTNGVITFDVATNANTVNAYILDETIPFAGGIPNEINNSYYPRAAIMAPYHDIDPDPTTTFPQQPRRRMEYVIEGNAPCRKFILNFYDIPYYMCPTEIVSQQTILYEGTGIIDIFIEKKPSACNQSSNGGTAILGIQNWDRDKAVVVPGRNNTVWTANKEGWRFVPSGSTSLLNRIELYKNNTLITAASNIVDLGNGELEASFAGICQTEDSMSYTIKAFYDKCDNPAIETEGSDTIIVYKTLTPVAANTTPILCNGALSTITISAPIGAGIEYSINNGTTWQTSTVFNVSGGNYIILARGTAANCSTNGNITINEPAVLKATANATNTTCAGNDGKIVVTAADGTPPYQYSINNGNLYQSSNIFLVQPGNYNNIIVKDANGCTANTSASILFTDQMFLTIKADTTVCAGVPVTLNVQTNNETTSFEWLPATGLNNTAIKNPIATLTDTLSYTVTASWGVCRRSGTTKVNILRKPIVNAGADTIVCYNTSAFLNGSVTNTSGAVNYNWLPVNSVSSVNTGFTSASPANTQLYTLTVTDNYICNFTEKDSILVTVRPIVKAFAGNDTIAVLGIPHQLFANGGTSYAWTPSSSLSNPFIANPLATLNKDTYFTLTVTNDIGCKGTDAVLVKVYKGPAFYLPNAFSPNGDGLNDIFKPLQVGITSTAYFKVFNRFGEIVFSTTQKNKGWDGTLNGKKADQGNYVWLIKGIDNTGKVLQIKGSVMLIR